MRILGAVLLLSLAAVAAAPATAQVADGPVGRRLRPPPGILQPPGMIVPADTVNGTAQQASLVRATFGDLWFRTTLGSLVGTGVGLFLGSRVEPDCCGDDPGLNGAVLGLTWTGSMAGSSLGAWTASGPTGPGSVRLGTALSSAALGSAVGLLATLGVLEVADQPKGWMLVTYPLVQGLTAAAIADWLTPD